MKNQWIPLDKYLIPKALSKIIRNTKYYFYLVFNNFDEQLLPKNKLDYSLN